jgi:hypothetical protein
MEFGTRFARLEMIDQYGDKVDLYDFYNDERPVVISIIAAYCPPGTIELAEYLMGSESIFSEFWPAGPEVIARGDVSWVTVISAGRDLQPDGSGALAAWWDDGFPVPGVTDPPRQAANFSISGSGSGSGQRWVRSRT